MKPQQPWTCADHESNVFAYLAGQLEPGLHIRAQGHLQSCSNCQAETQRWAQWKNAVGQDVATLSSNHAQTLAARISAAVDAQRPPHIVSMRRREPNLRYLSAAAAVMALAMAFLWRQATRLHTDAAPTLAPHAALESDDIDVAASVPTSLLDGRITMTLSDAQTIRWVQDEHGPTLSFTHGTLVAQVAPMPSGSSFRACTDTLCVRVIGTAFSLRAEDGSTAAQVQVLHGVVAVYHPKTPGIEVALYPGDQFRAPWSAVGAAAVEEVEVPAPAKEIPSKNVSECAARIRALGEDPIAAEPCLQHASAAQWAALADAYLRLKLPMRAYAAYAKIHRDFSHAPEAETALFSLATLEMERHQLGAADQRFGEYLKRYPAGDLTEQAQWQRCEIAVQEHDFTRAVKTLHAFVSQHHDSDRVTDGLFLLGSIYDREFDDVANASSTYKQLLARPDTSPSQRKTASQRLESMGVGQ